MAGARIRAAETIAAVVLVAVCTSGRVAEAAAPAGFADIPVLTGLTHPTSVRFASDGRVFVAQQDGKIWVFDSLGASSPTLFGDLTNEVDNYWDRGLLSIALDPDFSSNGYVYALITYDAPPGQTAPVWNDACPGLSQGGPGPTTDGCVVSGRLVRLQAVGDVAEPGSERVLIKDEWCQQYPSHSIGDLRFGQDGALYASSGEGSSLTFVDYGQGGGSPGSPTPKNPCGDPPAGTGGNQTPPTAEGGALRAQSPRRPPGEPVTLSGTIARVDLTGPGLPRIVAYGLRNPFRFTVRPGTNELWIGDVGAATWEEIDRVADPTAPASNFGWPCYEGPAPQPAFQALGLDLCASLYATGGAASPYYAYDQADRVVPGESCPSGSSSISGLAFSQSGAYPAAYDGALFFADHSRNCIWAMAAGANGLPDPSRISTFVAGGGGPVDLEIGPGGDLFYVGYDDGAIHRIVYDKPVAVASASRTSGSPPLTVDFDGTGSSGQSLSYAWDLDGDGSYDDSSSASPTITYAQLGSYRVSLKVTDVNGVSDVGAPITISVTAPSAGGDGGGGAAATATDLALTMLARPGAIDVRGTVTYTIVVRDKHSERGAHGVMLTAVLPDGAKLLSAQATSGLGCLGTTTVVCNLDALPASATAVVTIAARLTRAGTARSTVAVRSTETDLDPTDNDASATTLVRPAAGAPTLRRVGGDVRSPLRARRVGPRTLLSAAIAIDRPCRLEVSVVDVKSGRRLPLLAGSRVESGVVGGARTILTYRLAAPGTVRLELRLPTDRLRLGRRYAVRVRATSNDGHNRTLLIPVRYTR